jgi:hypothetical protein
MTDTILDISQELAAKYPNFASMPIYGTREAPLFPSKDIGTLLNITRFHFEHYDEDLDYTRAVAPCRDGGLRERVMFTEQGLYNVVFRSRSPIGKEFRTFVGLLLRELRLKGMIRVDDILHQIADKIRTSSSVATDHLYIITDGSWVKIGRSENVEARICNLQMGNPLKLDIVKIYENMGRYESLVHVRARALTREHRGEWFKLGDQLANLQAWISELEDD